MLIRGRGDWRPRSGLRCMYIPCLVYYVIQIIELGIMKRRTMVILESISRFITIYVCSRDSNKPRMGRPASTRIADPRASDPHHTLLLI
jgi:hypothetical protein